MFKQGIAVLIIIYPVKHTFIIYSENDMTTPQAKFLINCKDGKNNIEHATISFVLATSASKEHETAVFLTADASYWAVKGASTGAVYEGMEPIENLIQQFTDNGGKLWVCPICAKIKGITENDLIAGAEIAGAPKTMAFLASGGHVLA